MTTSSATFTATGLSYGQTRSGIAVCTVTDTVSGLTAIATCLVSITAITPPQILTEGGIALLTESGIPLLIEPGIAVSAGTIIPLVIGQLAFNNANQSELIPILFGWA